MNMSEFDDAYDDQQRIRGAILETPISELPLRVRFWCVLRPLWPTPSRI